MTVFRKVYRELSEDERLYLNTLKDVAEEMWQSFDAIKDTRARAIARTKLEEAIMWAVKGVTA